MAIKYVDTTEDDTNKQEETLGEVKNIKVDVTTANVVIKWDTVENASYYEVSVNTDPESKTKTSSNSTRHRHFLCQRAFCLSDKLSFS